MAIIIAALLTWIACDQLRWDCWEPGGGEIKDGVFYKYKNCKARFGLNEHGPLN